MPTPLNEILLGIEESLVRCLDLFGGSEEGGGEGRGRRGIRVK